MKPQKFQYFIRIIPVSITQITGISSVYSSTVSFSLVNNFNFSTGENLQLLLALKLNRRRSAELAGA